MANAITAAKALEDIEIFIRKALLPFGVEKTAQIRKLLKSKDFSGEISNDGRVWYKFRVGTASASILAEVKT